MTIGCPFDFIRTYWPDYFEGRKSLEDTIPKLWVNIYSAADVLSSDFLDQPAGTWRRKAADSQPQPTEAGVGLGDSQIRRPDKNLLYGRPTPLGQYGTLDKLSFVGFRMHKYYWEGDSTGCYLNIVRELYRRDPALA
ncbi:MAG TPA: hypothetical protein VLV83_24940 [Acidobacteriota bacterium]|nr:hypothetical protein [Acidobacteriota bacterium]